MSFLKMSFLTEQFSKCNSDNAFLRDTFLKNNRSNFEKALFELVILINNWDWAADWDSCYF